MENNVEQCGRFIEVSPGKVIVRILAASMCSSCHAKGACTTLDHKEKDIEVKTQDYNKYKVNDDVKVYMESKLGFKAVLIGFVLPFLAMIGIIILLKVINPNIVDGILAISALLSLGLYYVLIYLLRNKIEKQFVFKIKANL